MLALFSSIMYKKLIMIDEERLNHIIKSFLTPLSLIISHPKTIINFGSLEHYYSFFCNFYKNFPEIYNKIRTLEPYFSNLDSKNTDEKIKTIIKLYSLFEGPFIDFSIEDLNKMENYLKKPIKEYHSVGEKTANLFAERGILTTKDLICYLPYRYIDKRYIFKIKDLKPGLQGYFRGKVISIEEWTKGGFLEKSGKGIIVKVADETGSIILKWFNKPPIFIKNLLQKKVELLIFGKVEIFRGQKEIHHPEIEKYDETKIQKNEMNFMIQPLYFGLPDGIGDKFYRKLLYEILLTGKKILKTLIPQPLKSQLNLLEWGEAIFYIHFPKDDFNYELYESFRSPYHLTLLYQELFLLFALFYKRKSSIHSVNIQPLSFTGSLARKILNKLGYKLTDAQKRVLKEIKEDLEKPFPMQRLLQGDVGSGKTIVALLSALLVIEAGKQVAIMAPTEILAEQHYLNFKSLISDTELSICLLTSSLKKKERETILEEIRTGKHHLIVGTHALIQENVNFHDLGLVIIDEQHRFGVEQRNILIKKGDKIPHALFMTATPIPRTLAMTIHGDLDLSIIDEMPPGRKEIKTIVLPEIHREKAFSILEGELKKGRQAYVVYPVIDEDNTLELKAASKMYEIIRDRFNGYTVGLLHGRLKPEEKESIMDNFKRNNISILVATTVVEVGVDVPNATVMIIEHGERFGLSQLHQLRGRIGRGGEASICIVLVDTKKLSNKARERLIFFRDNRDGFKLAEFDLKLRGPGEMLGTKQSGMPELMLVDLIRDSNYIEYMKKKSEDILSKSDKRLLETNLTLMCKIYFGEKIDLLNAG
jgi:ATP-dependent DNA helicase RecG